MSVDKIEIDQDLKGVKVRVRRARTFRNPRLFNDWVEALLYAATELELKDELKAALNASVEKTVVDKPSDPTPDSDAVDVA